MQKVNEGLQYGGELHHYGIKGQKWGIRRFQNEDGTLTEAGKARYAKLELRSSRRAEKKARKAAKRKEKILSNPKLLRKHMNEFSDEEVDAALRKFNRARQVENAEREYINVPKRDADVIIGYGKTALAAYGTYAAFDKILKNYKKAG